MTDTRPRCVCGCSAATHDHYRPGTDCGACGHTRCPHYVPLTQRDTRYLTWPQRHALAESDTHFYRNLAALGPFARSGEQIAAARIPAQRTRTVAAVIYERRSIKTRQGKRREIERARTRDHGPT